MQKASADRADALMEEEKETRRRESQFIRDHYLKLKAAQMLKQGEEKTMDGGGNAAKAMAGDDGGTDIEESSAAKHITDNEIEESSAFVCWTAAKSLAGDDAKNDIEESSAAVAIAGDDAGKGDPTPP